MNRLALEHSFRSRGDISALASAAIHNVRLHAGALETYGRDDWTRLETARFAAWGPGEVANGKTLSQQQGAAALAIATRWNLKTRAGAVPCAALSLVHAGRVVREWQYYDRLRLGYGAGQTPAEVFWPRRHGVPFEYGELRASLGQIWPSESAAAVAAAEIATHPLVLAWHALWNLRRGPMPPLLAPFAEPVMFAERLIAGADGSAALQWRLVGRLVADAYGIRASRARLELPGLSFFATSGDVAQREDYFDPAVLLEQTAQRAA